MTTCMTGFRWFSKILCIPVLWSKLTSVLEGLRTYSAMIGSCPISTSMCLVLQRKAQQGRQARHMMVRDTWKYTESNFWLPDPKVCNSKRQMIDAKNCQLIESWHMGTHLKVLSEIYPMDTYMTGFRWFSEIKNIIYIS